MRLKDKVAIVTGAASGVGHATAVILAREGARVTIADMAIQEANLVADEIKGAGNTAIAVEVDIRDIDQVKEMTKITLDTFGHIDILVNVAGGSLGRFIREKKDWKDFSKTSQRDWDLMMNVNLYGAVNCTRAVINHMKERGYGRVINFASVSGLLGQQKCADYAAAKAAVIGFTKSLAKEVASFGISVNSISPGLIASPRVLALPHETVEEYLKWTPIGRPGKPEEVAHLVLLLASDEAGFIIGENIVIDGGVSLGLE